VPHRNAAMIPVFDRVKANRLSCDLNHSGPRGVKRRSGQISYGTALGLDYFVAEPSVAVAEGLRVGSPPVAVASCPANLFLFRERSMSSSMRA
jgi:hypothetical protein